MTANAPTDAGAVVLTAPNLSSIPGLVHGFTTRLGGVSTTYCRTGDLNLGYTPDDSPAHVRENRASLQTAVGASQFRGFGLLSQKHTPVLHHIRSVSHASAGFGEPGRLEGDALATDLPGVLLTIQTADCIPVLVCEPQRRVIAAFHAGWRGTVERIVEHGIRELVSIYAADPAKMVAAIGPGIGPESYQVSEDVHRRFVQNFAYADDLLRPSTPGHFMLNLWEANRRQLMDAGLPSTSIALLAEDTAVQTDRFFSYRAEHGRTGRMMSVIGLREA